MNAVSCPTTGTQCREEILCSLYADRKIFLQKYSELASGLQNNLRDEKHPDKTYGSLTPLRSLWGGLHALRSLSAGTVSVQGRETGIPGGRWREMDSDTIDVPGQAARTRAHHQGKYLTFSLAGEEYGIEILKVKEIIGMMPITAVPRAPGQIKGVINLRGKVIPVVDLRIKFGISPMGYTERTCIIVVEIALGAGKVFMGIVVDSVSEVLNIRAEDVESAPDFGSKLDTGYILGMAKSGQGVKILLDIDRVMGTAGAEVISGMS